MLILYKGLNGVMVFSWGSVADMGVIMPNMVNDSLISSQTSLEPSDVIFDMGENA